MPYLHPEEEEGYTNKQTIQQQIDATPENLSILKSIIAPYRQLICWLPQLALTKKS